jgi:single-stranded-DNA-specific exonuclease
MAAGLTVRTGMIEPLRAFLCERLAQDSASAAEADVVEIDALITPQAASRSLFEDFQRLAPFGPGNSEPVFALGGVFAEQAMPLRGGHVRCVLTDGHGGRLKAIAWRVEDTDFGRRLRAGQGALHVAGRLKADDYMGREGVQLEIEDAADPRMCA